MLWLVTATTLGAAAASDQQLGWYQHGLDAGATRFSPLDQVNTGNVAQLQIAWVEELGFAGRVQGSPVVWRDLLFVSTEAGITAFDAATGVSAWTYSESNERRTVSGLPVQAPRGSPLVIPRADGTAWLIASLPSAPVVVALDAATGATRWRTDVGRADFAEALRTNPTLANDIVIVGPTGADLSPVPGRLVALRAADGSEAWTFDLVPIELDDPARASWAPFPPGRSFGTGGGSAWNAGAYDEVNDIVVFGTGEPIPADQLDPRRFDGAVPATADLYTSSFVAVKASTGALAWYHQVVPGDEWGFDQHTVPIITELVLDGQERRVVLLATTTGFLLTLDVLTGSIVAAHDVAGIGNVHLGYDTAGAAVIDQGMRRSAAHDVVQVCPGSRWANIAPAAFSPITGLVYRPNDLACVRQGSASVPDDWQPGGRPNWLLSEARQPEDYFERWGALSAIDPATGAEVWRFDLPYPHDAGTMVTAGDLVFSGFADRQFRAFDARTGEVLWSQLLTAHADAAPITFMVDDVQYIAVLCGRDVPVQALPASGLQESVAGPATLFVFALSNDD